MLFKTTAVQAEFFLAHPALRRKLFELDAFIRGKDWPELVVTDVMRTSSFYPDGRFSWHFVGTAADIRSHDYTQEQKLETLAHLAKICAGGKWDCLLEKVGQPDEHFHLELEVPALKDAWLARKGSV